MPDASSSMRSLSYDCTREHGHLHESCLVEFAAGVLPAPFELIVARHLRDCARCRSGARDAARIGASCGTGARFVCLPGTLGPAATALGRRVDDILAGGGSRPAWWHVFRGLEICAVGAAGQAHLWLLRAQPGTVLPAHGHTGDELTLVLSGSYFDGRAVLDAGAVEEADEAVEHQPVVTSATVCICLAATRGGLRFRRLLPRLVRRVVGL